MAPIRVRSASVAGRTAPTPLARGPTDREEEPDGPDGRGSFKRRTRGAPRFATLIRNFRYAAGGRRANSSASEGSAPSRALPPEDGGLATPKHAAAPARAFRS